MQKFNSLPPHRSLSAYNIHLRDPFNPTNFFRYQTILLIRTILGPLHTHNNAGDAIQKSDREQTNGNGIHTRGKQQQQQQQEQAKTPDMKNTC